MDRNSFFIAVADIMNKNYNQYTYTMRHFSRRTYMEVRAKILQRFVRLYNDVQSPHVRLHIDAKGALEAMFLYNEPKVWVSHPSLSTTEDMLDRMLAEPVEVPRVALLQADNYMHRILCQAFMEVYDGNT